MWYLQRGHSDSSLTWLQALLTPSFSFLFIRNRNTFTFLTFLSRFLWIQVLLFSNVCVVMCSCTGGFSHTAVQGPDGPERVWQHQIHYWQVSWFSVCPVTSEWSSCLSVGANIKTCEGAWTLIDEEQVIKYKCPDCDLTDQQLSAPLFCSFIVLQCLQKSSIIESF